jgi:hypothetical protein
MNHISRSLASLILALVLLGPWSAITHAAGGASFSLRPVRYDPAVPATQSYFIIRAENGQSFQDEVRVSNTGDAAGTARLYPVDAATGANSGLVYLSSADPRTDVGAWITLDQDELTLGPGENRIVKFTVTIPRDARPGQHLGGLVAENAQTEVQPQQGALQVNFQRRMVTAVQVNLPGASVEKLAITGVTSEVAAGYQVLRIGLRNEGTELVKPVGTVQVADARGQTVQNLKLTLQSILPHNEIKYPVAIERQVLAPGDYHALVAITYGKQGVVSYETTFTVSTAQVAQIYEAQGQQLAPGVAPVSGLASYLPWVLIGVLSAVVLGMLVFRRRPPARKP